MKLGPLFFILISFSFLTFTACKQQKAKEESSTEIKTESLTEEEIQKYTEDGTAIAKATFMSLSGNLKKALTDGGVKEASAYCNVVALPLTDSLSNAHNASIKRTSFKIRNPKNKSTPEEFKVLQGYENQIKAGQQVKPMVNYSGEDIVNFYAPIITQQLCLTCHGTLGRELTEENYSILKELYPEDQAIGYKENELRGIWSIALKKEI